MARQCFALDLKDDATLIAAYERWHQEVWPEIKESILTAGIEQMEIYRTGNRLFMIMETNSQFNAAAKAADDAANPKVQAWEELMWQYQQPLPWAKDGEKWIAMQPVFSLT